MKDPETANDDSSIHWYDFDYRNFAIELKNRGLTQDAIQQTWKRLYVDLVETGDELPSSFRKICNPHAAGWLAPLKVSVEQESQDQSTTKYLLKLPDEETVETVCMRFAGRQSATSQTTRFTACVSTQVGCAMGCVFCATGQMGFRRHLSTAEIIGQVLFVQRRLRPFGNRLRNLVFMGMGEPLHNYDNTLRAISILADANGIGIAPRHITLSTIGIPGGIRKLALQPVPIRLAVSLHSANDAQRQEIVPTAKKWSLQQIMEACRFYTIKRKQKIFFEWTLIKNVNDSIEQAAELASLLQGIHAHVNLIPLNNTEGYAATASRSENVLQFQAVLAKASIPSTVRQRRGIDIAAGCGQLRQPTIVPAQT